MTDKRVGRHCSFLNLYVGIHVKYEKNGTFVRSCEESGCSNSKCNLSRSFMGSRTLGQDALDYPKK
ncbi:hypothetical protein Ethha_2229 [Ethanoligenens harbinense YUAN-3]|uniref:Uncharacterized protein n=1 Tax=Ethanoligenens harbinense (strain DSM 18485 / JCM 12961 / CGMCC 1.5033 / YUAN-3) TaxID=663278 RepID=E6U4D7_ETHHY|nr:hypothetical protein Ethha_2229 [Ethanoligenens harbinense YUAN-3]